MPEPGDPYPDLFETLVARRRAGERVVLVTVVATRGSTPRQAGARMLVLADGSIRGTVGGGVRESEIIAAARELHRRGGSRLLGVDLATGLGGEVGPICGGHMEVFMEAIDPPHRVVIAGAGHIAYFLHRFLSLLEMSTVVVDPRPEFANPERFPGAELRVVPFEEALAGLTLGTTDGVVIVTKGHEYDQSVLRQALATAAGYLGMIGSRSKVAAVFQHLRDEGVGEEQLQRVHAPVGMAIGAETPAEIALAIAAEIVATFRARLTSA
jgi:xanthine dehydrogenase accessory factor